MSSRIVWALTEPFSAFVLSWSCSSCLGARSLHDGHGNLRRSPPPELRRQRHHYRGSGSPHLWINDRRRRGLQFLKTEIAGLSLPLHYRSSPQEEPGQLEWWR